MVKIKRDKKSYPKLPRVVILESASSLTQGFQGKWRGNRSQPNTYVRH